MKAYEEFLETRLRRDAARATAAADAVEKELAEYRDLAAACEELERTAGEANDGGAAPLRTLVDLGGEVLCQAEIEPGSMLFVNVGLGFHVALTAAEAKAYAARRKPLLEKRLQERRAEAAAVQANIKLVTEGIRELMRLPAEGPRGGAPLAGGGF